MKFCSADWKCEPNMTCNECADMNQTGDALKLPNAMYYLEMSYPDDDHRTVTFDITKETFDMIQKHDDASNPWRN